jgi:hypothetical protein
LSRAAVTRGPMPQSMSIAPEGERRIEQFPDDPLARLANDRDIRVEKKN